MQLWENATMQHNPGITHSYAGINPVLCPQCCESVPKGILAMLVLESLQHSYRNDSLYYVDTVVVRLGQNSSSDKNSTIS